MYRMYRMILATVAVALSSVTASAETITVCAKGCDYTSINAAIAAASNGDVIQLSAETYFEGSQIDTLGKAITLRGVSNRGGYPASVLDGADAHRVLICQSGEDAATVFDNLVIQNGYGAIDAGGAGGGLYNHHSSPTVTNCEFTNNTAALSGGGMYSRDSSSPTLTDCTFTNNSADRGGGGMYSGEFCSPTLTRCEFTSNSSDHGGGMENGELSSPTLTSCEFTSNLANYGGGMYNYSSSPTLTNCTFESNSAVDSGGGMSNYSSSPTLTTCTFTNNTALVEGGGMRNYNSSPTLTSCTFTNNTALVGGGGMHNNAQSSPTLTDCTFTECCQVDPPRSFVDGGGNDYESWCDDCRADVNCRDDAVNAADLGMLIEAWGTNDPQCDINGDGAVSAADLGLLIGAWGPCQ
ncbi:MAG: right-handed parallel beta-helix repeat-containing protein [Phycisphaerales bacterium]|nr:right-handed parallel beta-helix repeat-containing protein [Phycisphaerales bacterium]